MTQSKAKDPCTASRGDYLGADLEEVADLRYCRTIRRVPAKRGVPERFVGRIPALSRCTVVGYDRDDVLRRLDRRAAERLESLIRAGAPVPPSDLPPGFEGMVMHIRDSSADA